MIGRISDNNHIIRSDRDSSRPGKVSGATPPTSYLETQLSLLQVLTFKGSTYLCETLKQKHRKIIEERKTIYAFSIRSR